MKTTASAHRFSWRGIAMIGVLVPGLCPRDAEAQRISAVDSAGVTIVTHNSGR